MTRWAIHPLEPNAIVDTAANAAYTIPNFLTFLNAREEHSEQFSTTELHILLAAHGIPHTADDLRTAMSRTELATLLDSQAPTTVVQAALRRGFDMATGWDVLRRQAPGEKVGRRTKEEDIVAILREAMQNPAQEEVMVIGTDRYNTPLTPVTITHTGNVNAVAPKIMELLWPIGRHAHIIMAHTHPGGDPTPSRADLEYTEKIVLTMAELGVMVREHYVICANGNYARILADHLPAVREKALHIIEG